MSPAIRITRFMRAIAPAIVSFVILLALVPTNVANAEIIEVTICTFDSSDSSQLNGSVVEVREGTNPVSSGQTGSDGCVTLEVEVSTVSGIDDIPGVVDMHFSSAFPNPMSERTRIPFSNDISQPIDIAVFDLLGREVAASHLGVVGPGNYAIAIEAAALSRGIYFYRVTGRHSSATGQFVKIGEVSGGNIEMSVESYAGATLSKTLASSLSITIARLGYQPSEEVREADDGETLNFFLTSESLQSDFDFSAAALEVSFENHSTGAVAFEWEFGDGSTSNEENPMHEYSTEGEYNVMLVAINGTESDSTMKTVSVSLQPEMIPLDRTDLYSSGQTYYGEAYAWPNDPSAVPSGSVIVGTGYSNASQHFNTFDAQYQSQMNPEFINCGVGSNAIENWIGQNTEMLFEGCIDEIESAGYTAADVALTMNLIANQIEYPAFPDPGSGVFMLEDQVQELGQLLEQYFPNAIHMYTTGEPAHFVEPSKCPRICEPIRYETGFGVNRALQQMDSTKHIHGAYLWSSIDTANASGELWVVEDYLNPTGDGYANQHPSDSGREKASRIYHAFLSAKYPTWYPN